MNKRSVLAFCTLATTLTFASIGQAQVTKTINTSSQSSMPKALPVPFCLHLDGREMPPRSCGYLNVNGQAAFSKQFDRADEFSANGLAVVELDGMTAYIKTNGEFAFSRKFRTAGKFSTTGLAAVSPIGGEKYGYINIKGEMVIPPQFGSADEFARNGLAAVRLTSFGKVEYIDEKGRVVIPPQYHMANKFSSNGLAAIETVNGLHGFINSKGETVISPKYSYAGDFASNGLAYVWLNDKVGYINRKGEMIIPPLYDKSSSHDFAANGLAAVCLNNKCGYINAEGKVTIPFTYKMTYDFSDNGLALVAIGDPYGFNWGFINKSNQMVIPPRLKGYSFKGGLAEVYFSGKQTSFINEKGEVLAYLGEINNMPILRNASGSIVWPTKAAEKIASDGDRNKERVCAHVYVGKQFSGKGGIFNMEWRYEVVGFSVSTGKVTITEVSDPKRQFRQEITCQDVPN